VRRTDLCLSSRYDEETSLCTNCFSFVAYRRLVFETVMVSLVGILSKVFF